MAYIVKSSLDLGGKIIPWNEQEVNKLIKDKQEMLQEEKVEISEQVDEQVSEQVQDAKVEKNAPKEKQDTFMRLKKEETKRNKRKDKVGDE